MKKDDNFSFQKELNTEIADEGSQQSKARLTAKEKKFCRIYHETRDKRLSAYLSGYKLFPMQSALKLLEKKSVINQLKTLSEKDNRASKDAEAGLRRIAFGSSADAVKLIFSDEMTDEQIEQLDLYMVSDIKKPKGGGLEIKFFDRLKALEALGTVDASQNDGALPFYRALENSAVDEAED